MYFEPNKSVLLTIFFLVCLTQPLLADSHHRFQVPKESDNVKRHNFSFDTRLRYNDALVNNIKSINLLVATRMGRTSEAIRDFKSSGGQVGFRSDTVGYFWGSLPTKNLPKLLGASDIVDIELDGPPAPHASYKEPLDQSELQPTNGWIGQERLSAPRTLSTNLPLLPSAKLEGTNPYLPWYLLGVTKLRTQHPTFDGRGTTIAVVEGYGDVFNPVLRTALDLNGRAIRKVVGILDVSRDMEPVYSDPGKEYGPSSWNVKMDHTIFSTNSVVEYRGVKLTLPAAGCYKIAPFETRGRKFWVLWSLKARSVWVDTNGDNSFADELPIRDIETQVAMAQTLPEPGIASQELPVRSSFSFAKDRSKSLIRIYLNPDDHATAVASVAAGEGFLGGHGGGVAPGARILFVTTGNGSLGDDMRAFIETASRSDVDVITCSFVIKPMIAGETVTSLVVDRIAKFYHKPMFFTATAGPMYTTDDISDLASAPHVFGIMGYTTPELWRAFENQSLPMHDNDPDGGGEGPAISGAIKPDFVTPFHPLAAGYCHPDAFLAKNRSTVIGYTLPECYLVFAGTSASTPEAAGLAAIMISAAKQTGRKPDLDRLAWSLRSSARFLDKEGEPIGYQGYGLPNVFSAWGLFTSPEPTPQFMVSTHSHGPHESERRTPGLGVGIYEYLGWNPGMRGERQLILTRNSGRNASQRYELQWRGNDGTFSSPRLVNLRRGVPNAVIIKIAPTAMGIHQAVLELVEPNNHLILKSIINTVVVSARLDYPDHDYEWDAQVPLSHEKCSIVDVPSVTKSLVVDVSVSGGPADFFTAHSPTQGSQDLLGHYLATQNLGSATFRQPGVQHFSFSDPIPGPWGFCVRNSLLGGDPRIRKATYVQVSIKVKALAVKMQPDHLVLKQSHLGSTSLQTSLNIHNLEASIPRATLDNFLGYTKSYSISLPTKGNTSLRSIEIPSHAHRLLLEFTPNRPSKNFGVAVYSCNPELLSRRDARCALEDYREAPRVLEYINPTMGRWKILFYRLGGVVSSDNGQINLKETMALIPAVTSGGVSISNPWRYCSAGCHADIHFKLHLPSSSSPRLTTLISEITELNDPNQNDSTNSKPNQGSLHPPAILGQSIICMQLHSESKHFEGNQRALR